jgi:hypothetical protein
MKYNQHKSSIYALFLTVFLFWCTRPAFGLILHPDGEPNLTTWMDRPHKDIIGRWGNNACCVAVSSNCVITTRHQGGNVSTPVEIGGNTYTVMQIWAHDTADLCIAKLYGANLINFVGIYGGADEVGNEIVIVGYGDGRDSLLQKAGITYGYQWDNSSNTTLRFGTNKIEDAQNDSTVEDLTSDILIADFDGLNEGESTVYESIGANHDSGGGWFIKVNDTWKLAGLSRTVEQHFEQGHEDDPNYTLSETWFRKPTFPRIPQADYLDAVRISSYAQWINDTIPGVLPGDLNGDDYIDFADLTVFGQYWQSPDCDYPDWCAGADFEPDGDVDWEDFVEFSNNWLKAGE